MRKININTSIKRGTRDGKHYFIDPILGDEVGPFDSEREREDAISSHYNEMGRCKHEWEILTRVRCHYEISMVSGQQRCKLCGETVFYRMEDFE